MSKLKAAFIALILLAAAGTALAENQSRLEEEAFALIAADKVNLRAGRGTNFEIIGQLNKGQKIVTLEKIDGWYKIELPFEALCFVHKEYVKDGVVLADKLHIRAARSTNANILGVLERGDIIEVLAEDGDWLKIAPGENCSGWVNQEFVTPILKPSESALAAKAPAPVVKKQQIKAEGRIKDLGKIINRAGTHKLVTVNKSLYYLKSESINLNDYIYRQAEVSGELVPCENSKFPVINVTEIRLK